MTALPRISIVTPSRNQARYIRWTVRSVILQDYPNLEYIVMDGGSTDDTCDVLEPYLPFLAHFQSAPDKGQADAIASGLRRSSGEIMAYLNSDDMLAPGALHFVAEYFRDHPDLDVVYSHRSTVDERNNAIWYWKLPPHSDYLMRRWDMIPQETTFWRRRIYEDVGGLDPSYQFAMDYDLFVRFMERGRLKRVARFLGAYRQHSQSKASTIWQNVGLHECNRIYEAYSIRKHPWHTKVGKQYQRAIVKASYNYAARGDALPGALPGLGWNYDQLWQGQLDSHALPTCAA